MGALALAALAGGRATSVDDAQPMTIRRQANCGCDGCGLVTGDW